MTTLFNRQHDRIGASLTADEAAIIAAIRTHGALSRTDLARISGYSRAKMTSVVGRLVANGVLQEVGSGDSQGGRRPRLLNLNRNQGFVVGVEIGATSLDIGVADLGGNILERAREPADVARGPHEVLGRTCTLILDLLAHHGIRTDQVCAIGLGVPGPVEFSTGLLIAPPLMPEWEAFPIRSFIRELFPAANVIVDNDVNVMAIGELRAGGGIGVENFIVVKIGTGIGSGIICHGTIYRGSDGCAGDIGHICVDPHGPVCRCGNIGCVEAMAAGPAIAARGLEAARSQQSPVLVDRLQANGNATLTAEDVGAAVARGDRAALEIVQTSGQLIGEALAGIVNFFNPRLILIGGGVSTIGHQLLSSIRQTVLRRSPPLSTKDLRIDYVGLGRDAGVVGAVTLALEHVFTTQT